MNVKKLREIIKDLPDNTPLLAPSGSHSFRHAAVHKDTALFDAELGEWTEDHGESCTPESGYGKRITVLVVG